MLLSMKKLLRIVVLTLMWIIPVSADDNCVDKNPEIILNLGGTPEPEKIIYATYDSCTKQHDYCGIMGCSLEVFDNKGNYAIGYIAKDDWYIKPINEEKGVGKKPTYELVVPLANGDLRVIKVINDKITETVIKK